MLSARSEACSSHLPRIDMNDATLRYEIPSNVLGMVRTKQIMADTPAQSTEHDAPEVTGSTA